jgi:hypothetical protein
MGLSLSRMLFFQFEPGVLFQLRLSFCLLKLSNLVANEFFEQGDLEKEKFNNEPIVCWLVLF